MTNINSYYKYDTNKLINFVVPKNKSKSFIIKDIRTKAKGKNDYIVLENIIGDLNDVQNYLSELKKNLNQDGRLLITYYNHLWEPILKLASNLDLRNVKHEQNWLDNEDIRNLLELSGYDVITHQRRLLIPIYIPIISSVANKWLAHLPLLNSLCLTTWVVARIKPEKKQEYTVSVIVPARNEEGNIGNIVKSIPRFGKAQEIIFVEGKSNDATWERITKEVKKYNSKKIKVLGFKQKGEGKGDALKLGFKKATGEILIVLDADLTVNPKELTKFYEVLAKGYGEFVNGSRMIYPMEKQAMRTLNKLGNKIFSWFFTWILGQRFKDTLCGTKALFKSDYKWILKNKIFFGNFDPFGDFDLIFGAIKANLKVVEIPVRYRERKYGTTNISRFKNGLQLLTMTAVAFKKFKAW